MAFGTGLEDLEEARRLEGESLLHRILLSIFHSAALNLAFKSFAQVLVTYLLQKVCPKLQVSELNWSIAFSDS